MVRNEGDTHSLLVYNCVPINFNLILELKNSKLKIRFKDNSIRTYMFPLGFELDLSFEDTNLQTEIETIIIPKRICRKNIQEDYNNFIKASRIKKNIFLNKVSLSISRAQAKSNENGDFVTLPFESCIPATQYVKQKSYEEVGKYYLGFNPCWSANHDYETDETTYSIKNPEYDRIDKKRTGENVKARIAAVCPVIRVREK